MIKLVNALGDTKILPLTMSAPRIPLDIDTPVQDLQGRDGSVPTGKTTLRARQFVIEGSIYYPNKSELESELDSLLAFLMHSPLKFYRTKHSERYLTITPQAAPQDWLDRGAEIRVRIPVEAYDPYWYGNEVSVELESGSLEITVEGTAPALPLVSSSGSFELSNGKQTLSVQGANIIVDTGNFTVMVDGQNRLDLVNEDWFALGFKLYPGKNTLTTTASVKLKYRPRWY